STGSSQATGGGDIRASNLAMGAADVFRASCLDPDPAGLQSKIFPSSAVDGFQTIAQTEANLVNHITSQRGGDGKLSLELWTPSCLIGLCDPGHDNMAYWSRYYTIRAADPSVRPRLVVTYQGSAVTGSVTLTAGAPDAQAGAAQVKLKDVPPSAIVGSALGVSSAPLGSIPLGSIPVGSIPLGSIPVGSIPLGSIGLNASQTLLSSVSISTIPLVPPSSWSAILAGTPLASVPIQNVTLGQVLANTTAAGRLNSVPLGSINLTR